MRIEIRITLALALLPVLLMVQGRSTAQNVGININNPALPLHVRQQVGVLLNEDQPVIFGEYTGNNLEHVIGVKGFSRPGDEYGYGGVFEGGAAGVLGSVAPTGSGFYLGAVGLVDGGSGVNIGAAGSTIGAGTNYGVYGSALGGLTNYAGYFSAGNVRIENMLGIGDVDPPEFPLHVRQPLGMELENDQQVIFGEYTGTNHANVAGVHGRSVPADGWGIGGLFGGGYMGLQGYVLPSGGGGVYFGVNGIVDGGAGQNVGVYGSAFGGGLSFGVFGSAQGASNPNNNWAGFFADGKVFIRHRLGIGTANEHPAHPLHVRQPPQETLDDLDPVILGEYTGTNQANVIGVKGYSKPADGYGLGGFFEGGQMGMYARVFPTGSGNYHGTYGFVHGGNGVNIGSWGGSAGDGENYGVLGTAFDGSMTYGVYGTASGATIPDNNWAGYFANGNVRAENKVGIGDVSVPQHPLHVRQPVGVELITSQSVIFGEYTGTNPSHVIGVKGYSKPADGYGIGGRFEGGRRGVEAVVIPTGNEFYYGFYGFVNGGSGVNYGVSGEAQGSGYNRGIYGSALGGLTNWAGYFDEGNVYVRNDIGIGQLAPQFALDILKGQAVARLSTYESTNGSVLELRSTAASPALIGSVNFSTTSSTPGQIAYTGTDAMTFRVDGSERMRINSNGNVGIGTNDPSQKLYVAGNICATGTIGSCSDIRYKTGLIPLQDILSKISTIGTYTYQWKLEEYPDKGFDDRTQIGIIAQEIAELFPELILTDDDDFMSIDYARLSVVLLAAMKEQQATISAIESEMLAVKETWDAMMVEALRALNDKIEELERENTMIRAEIRGIRDLLMTGSPAGRTE